MMGDLLGYGKPIAMTYEFEDPIGDFMEFEELKLTYTGRLEYLSSGNILSIKGLVHDECEKFSINLYINETASHAASVYQFTVRLSQKFITCTYCCDSTTESNDISTCTPFPFKKEKYFDVKIFLKKSALYYQVDSNHFCEIALKNEQIFRSPTSIKITGSGVAIDSVNKDIASSYPVHSTINTYKYIPKYYESQNIKWDNPCIGILQENLTSGMQVLINGKIKLLPHSFCINFQSSTKIYPYPDVGLSISIKFMPDGYNLVRLNSRRKGHWGEYQVVKFSLLFPGCDFEMKINCDDDFYSVWIRNKIVAIFNYTLPPHCIKVIKIEGDVRIHKMHQTVKNEEILVDII